MPNITVFDSREHHIRLVGSMNTAEGVDLEFRAILDTGAPRTEFSDQFLVASGLIECAGAKVDVKGGLQTQKYDKLILSKVKICGHIIDDMKVYVSHFDKHWGVDALIGLDFFRRYRVTVDYGTAHIITEALAA